jgi:Flp pilus assembly protein TadB
MTGEGMAQDRQSSNPGWHLTRFLALLFFTGLFLWLGEKWQWPGTWWVAALLGFSALLAFIDMMSAHRVRIEIEKIFASLAGIPKRQHETRPDRDKPDDENWQ